MDAVRGKVRCGPLFAARIAPNRFPAGFWGKGHNVATADVERGKFSGPVLLARHLADQNMPAVGKQLQVFWRLQTVDA